MWLINCIHLVFDLLVEFVFRLFYTRRYIRPVRDEMLLMSATELARGIREKKFTSEAVVRAFIDRINEVNATLNAVVDTRFDEAVAEAVAVDENLDRYTSEELHAKPFLGVPFTAKESTLCQDMSSTFGLRQRMNVRANEDAAVIANMKNAGGILLAVTNVPSLNLWVETHNPVYGTSRNPYDTTCNTGGSSGGEAAIIAACGSPFGVGTDIGGSVRIPAFMCGIFGHKVSNGLTDTRGLTFRDGSESGKTMVTTGPMCKKAEDLIPGIKVLLGAKAEVLKLDEPVDLKTLKFCYIERNGDLRCSPLHADVAYINKAVVDHFKQYRPVERLNVPKLKYSSSLYKYWMEQECSEFPLQVTNRNYKASAGTELWKYITCRSDFPFSVILLLISTQWMPTVDGDWARKVTEEIRQYLLGVLDDNGVLFYPSWPQTATQHHVGYFRPFNYSYTSIFNLLKFPVTQVPLGLNKEGLPCGIQVVAAPNNDRLCIAVAKELEKVFGGYAPPASIQSKSVY